MSASVQPPATPPPPRSGAAGPVVPPAGPSPSTESSQGPSRGRLLVAVGAVAVLAVVILVVAIFATGRTGGDTGTGVQPPSAHSIAAPASGVAEGKFEIVSGAETLAVRCSDTGDDLYRASTPNDGSLVPQATTNGDTTQLSLVPSGANGAASAEVLLSSKVRWELTMAGGGLTQTIDCSAGRLSSLSLGQGAGDIEVSLPKPEGTMLTRLTGGAGKLRIHLPAGPPVQVKIGNGAGAGSISIDGQAHNDVRPGTDLTPAGWNQATDRYTVDATVGLASLTVDRS